MRASLATQCLLGRRSIEVLDSVASKHSHYFVRFEAKLRRVRPSVMYDMVEVVENAATGGHKKETRSSREK